MKPLNMHFVGGKPWRKSESSSPEGAKSFDCRGNSTFVPRKWKSCAAEMKSSWGNQSGRWAGHSDVWLPCLAISG